MKVLKNNKGITLVSLIITIIILLILATITIVSLNEGGIIGKAKRAKEDFEGLQDKQNGMFDMIESIVFGGKKTEGDITGGVDSGDEGSTEDEDSNSGENSGNNSLEQQNPNISSYTKDGVPIPVGFKYITGEKNTGVVIQNELDGSEFVWVPVNITIVPYGLETKNNREPDVITQEWYANKDAVFGADNSKTYLDIINNILGSSYKNSSEFLTVLQEDFNLMSESIKKNKGFYVGRYETSLNNGVAQVIKGAISARAEKDSANTWYGLYAYQKAYSTSSVQGSMIWGSQYDRMLEWMKSTGVDIESIIENNRNTDRTTGTKKEDKINNIYDIYGNSFEWTLEAYGDYYRIVRGGSYFEGRNLMSKFVYCPVYADLYIGSRMTLYIK